MSESVSSLQKLFCRVSVVSAHLILHPAGYRRLVSVQIAGRLQSEQAACLLDCVTLVCEESTWNIRSMCLILSMEWVEAILNCSLNDLTSVSDTTCSIDGWNTYRMFQDHSLLVMVEQAFSPAPCRSQPAICMETRCMVSRCAVTTCVETDTQPLCSNVRDFMGPVSEET